MVAYEKKKVLDQMIKDLQVRHLPLFLAQLSQQQWCLYNW